MPRGRKPALTLDEQLQKITEEIDDLKANIKELQKTKEDLEEQIHLNQLSELDDMITKSGLSFEEVKELLIREQDE